MKHDKIYKNELEPKRECTIRDVMRAQNKFGFQYCVSTTSLINKACTNIKEKEKRKKSLNLRFDRDSLTGPRSLGYENSEYLSI